MQNAQENQKPGTSCRYIEGGVSFHYSSIHVCSVPHHGTGQPFVAHFDGTSFPLTRILELREAIRVENQTPEGHPACRGCALLETKSWPRSRFVFDHLGLGNWLFCDLACSYCELQTRWLALETRAFRPYSLLPTIRQLVSSDLLANDATIDWGGGGEPLYYREFSSILALLLDHGTFNYIHTNGTRSPSTVRISAPERVHVICSIDAGTRETYFRVKGRDLFEKVFANLLEWKHRGSLVTLKYIVKTENADAADLEEFVSRAHALGPVSVILDIDFQDPEPSDAIVGALGRILDLLIQAGVAVSYGHTGDRFKPERGLRGRLGLTG
jgi:sulfatase maturation enzyme AslB (radical SAM superfamily)